MRQSGRAGEGTIGSRLEGSEREVVQIAIVDRLASLPFIRESKHAVVFAVMIVGSLPVVGCAIEYLDGRSVGWFVWMTAAIYGLLIGFMVYGARRSWAAVIGLGADIDAILNDGGRRIVLGRLYRALRWIPQALFASLGFAVSTWVGIDLTGPIGHHYLGGAAAAYVFTIGWTGGIGAITVYWLWGAPVMFYPLARTEQPRLDWVAPLQTPAVQKASRLMIESARFAAVGLLLFTIPISITLALSSSGWSVWVLSVSPLVFSLVTVLGCSVLPQIALEDLVRRGKSQTLAAIRPYLPTPPEVFEVPKPEVLSLIATYERLANAPVSVVDWRRFVEYLLLLLSAVVPIVIALLSR